MSKTLTIGMIFALVLGLTACGRGEPLELYENGTQGLEVIEREPLVQLPDPTETEDEPTHAILESRLGITLEYPVDWRFMDDGNLYIFPQGRPYRATWYDRTVFEVKFDNLDSDRLSHVDPEEWLDFHLNCDFAEPVTIDGVQAFLLWDITEKQINRTMHPYARTARYSFIHNDRLYEIEMRSGDGCLDEWAIMQDIFESIRLQHNVNTLNTGIRNEIEFTLLPNGTRVDTMLDDEIVDLIFKHFESIEAGNIVTFRETLQGQDGASMNWHIGIILESFWDIVVGEYEEEMFLDGGSHIDLTSFGWNRVFFEEFSATSRNTGLFITEIRYPDDGFWNVLVALTNDKQEERFYSLGFASGDLGQQGVEWRNSVDSWF